jgi:response regulator RpfG family c-di-GMP phosphodiesterase
VTVQTVVIIDDRITNLKILERLAGSLDAALIVKTFGNPRQALDFTTRQTPDLIITDFKMPELDGAEFIRQFRRQSTAGDVPVVVITAYEDRDLRYRALEAGATDFLLSPVDHLEFRARARNLLMLRRQQRLLADRAADLEQALTRQETAAGEDLLGRVLDAIPAAISIVDGQGRLVFANHAHEALLGVPRQEALGQQTIPPAPGLDQLAAELGVRWEVHVPFVGWRWAVGRWLAAARARREPARFGVIVGVRAR